MLSFLVLNAGALAVSALVAVAPGSEQRTSQLLLRTLCGYLIVVHSITLLAGLTGHLTVGGLATLLAAAVAGAFGLARRMSDKGEASTEEGARFTAAALFAPLAAITSGIVWAWPHVFEATRLWVWDDYTYHMVYPALWLREHTIGAMPPAHAFTMQAWYPLSASVVAAWFMAPFHGVRGEALAWVSLTGPLYAGIVVGGAVELFGRLGCRAGAWAVPAVLFLTSHRIDVMASSFSDADLAHAALLLAAMVFAVPARDHERERDVAVDAWYAALLSGIALGIKVSAAPQAAIIVLMMLLRARTPSAAAAARVRAATRIVLVFAASWVVTGGYWYARNIVHTGNPVYPAAFLSWPGTRFPDTTLIEYHRAYGLRRTLVDALHVYLNWPRWHAVLAVVGLVGLAIWLGFHLRSLPRCRQYFAWEWLATAAAILVVLPAAPYSAGNAMTFRAGFVHWDSMRYIALLPILGWMALGFLVDAGAGARHWRALAAILIAIAALLTPGIPQFVSPVVLLLLAPCAVLLASVGFRAIVWRPATVRGRVLAGGAVAIVMAGIVAGAHGAKARATAAAFYREPLFGTAAAVLDRQPTGTRIAVFGDQWVYPAFGARDHLYPLRLDRDGRVATAPIADAMEPGNLTVDPGTFRANLRASGLDLVVVIHLPHPGRSAQWPTQQAALEASGDARVLHRDGSVAIWSLD